MKKVVAMIIAVALCVALFAACSQAPAASASESAAGAVRSLDEIKASGKLVMLTNAAFPPYEYLGADNQVAGIDVDISQAVADKIGVKLEVVNMDFDGLIAALVGGKGDMVAAGLTIDDERKQSADFSDIYADATQLIIVPEGNTDINGPDDLVGKTIGVQLGTTGDLYCSDIEGATVKQYKSGIEAGLDLKNGKLDAVVIDTLPAQNIVDSNEGLKVVDAHLTDEHYAIAVQKGNTELTDVINSVIKELQASGKIDEWTQKHAEESSVSSAS